jgi:hypothetical protein
VEKKAGTELKIAIARLKELNGLKAGFISTVAYALQTPRVAVRSIAG